MRGQCEGHAVPASVVEAQIDDNSANPRQIPQDTVEGLSGDFDVGVPPFNL
jgi:hypothetical protein